MDVTGDDRLTPRNCFRSRGGQPVLASPELGLGLRMEGEELWQLRAISIARSLTLSSLPLSQTQLLSEEEGRSRSEREKRDFTNLAI